MQLSSRKKFASLMPIDERLRTIFVKRVSSSSSSSSVREGEHHSYRCSHCSKLFSSPSHLSRHLLIHTGEKPCLCSECGQQFSQTSSLDRHQRTKHAKEGGKLPCSNHPSFQCALCQEYFSLKHNLKMHQKKLHQIPTNFFCHLCSAYFTCNSSLQKHRNFRHRLSAQNQSDSSTTKIGTTSDNWDSSKNDQLDSNVSLFESSQTVVSPSSIEESSTLFSVDSHVAYAERLPSDQTILHSYREQQKVQYQILQCSEIT